MNENKDFFEYYRNLTGVEKSELRRRICEKCRVSELSFYNWMQRNTIPRWHRSNIAGLLNADEHALFPEPKIQLPEFSTKN